MKNSYYIKLNDICELITDGTHQTPTYSDNGYIFLSSKNVTNGIIDWENVKYIPEELHKKLYERIAPKIGDILLAKNGTTGIAALVDKNIIFDIYVSLALLRPKENILPEYLLWAINNPYTKRKFQANLKGIGVPNLHLSSIKETEIKFYEFSQQIYISNIMKRCQKIIDLKKQQLSELDRLVKFQFLKMFGEPINNVYNFQKCKIKDIALKKLMYGSGSSAVEFDNKVRYIRITDIDNLGNLKTEKVSPSLFEDKYLLSEGDILFARSGATVGKTFYFKKNYGKCIFAGYLIRLTPNQSKVLPEYLFYFTKTDFYNNFIKSNSKTVAQPNINAQQYENLEILIPPIELQNKFAEFVKQVDKSKVELQKSIDETQLLFDSLMDRYFG